MRRTIWLAVAVAWLVLWQPAVHAAGSVTVTTKDFGAQAGSRFRQYTVAWTSDASDGSVAAGVTNNTIALAAGRLVSVRLHPGATTPTNLYDVTLVETGGVGDLTAGQGANQSATVDGFYSFDPPLFLDGSRTVSVVVANAGNSKTGTVVILVQIS